MPETIIFDTHAFVKELVAAGMDERQAEVLSNQQKRLIETQLATKRDLKDLETRIIFKLGGLMVTGFGLLAILIKLPS